MTTYNKFYAQMLTPSIAAAYACLIVYFNFTVGCRGTAWLMVRHPEQQAKVQGQLFTRGKRTYQLVLACFGITFFFQYPSLIEEIVKLNHCRKFDVGTHTINLLAADYRIDCDSAEYQTQQVQGMAHVEGVPRWGGGGGGVANFFLSVGEKKCRLEKKSHRSGPG